MTSRIRTLGFAALVWVLVVVGVAVARPSSKAQRLGNLDLQSLAFPSRYLVFSRSEPGRCWEVKRHDATLRRSNDRQPGTKLHCRRLEAGESEGQGTWILQNKRAGTVALVPLLQVSDWSYPFLYEFVRARHPELDLPEISWVGLYSSRLYTGLHLRVPLPYDKRKIDGRLGPLRELLSVRDGELRIADTRLEAPHGYYASALAEGRFPSLAETPPALRWLASRAPTPDHTFLYGPEGLAPLPLPVSVPGLFRGLSGQAPPSFHDERYQRWISALHADAQSLPFGAGELEELRSELRVYADRLRDALRIEAELGASQPLLQQELPVRQAALADLDLGLGAL